MHKKKHIFHLSRGDKDPENQFHLDLTLDPFEVNDTFFMMFQVSLWNIMTLKYALVVRTFGVIYQRKLE